MHQLCHFGRFQGLLCRLSVHYCAWTSTAWNSKRYSWRQSNLRYRTHQSPAWLTVYDLVFLLWMSDRAQACVHHLHQDSSQSRFNEVHTQAFSLFADVVWPKTQALTEVWGCSSTTHKEPHGACSKIRKSVFLLFVLSPQPLTIAWPMHRSSHLFSYCASSSSSWHVWGSRCEDLAPLSKCQAPSSVMTMPQPFTLIQSGVLISLAALV